MKIDIITLHYIWHYGSLLQTYATCKVFEKLGLETEVIDEGYPNPTAGEAIERAGHIQAVQPHLVRRAAGVPETAALAAWNILHLGGNAFDTAAVEFIPGCIIQGVQQNAGLDIVKVSEIGRAHV